MARNCYVIKTLALITGAVTTLAVDFRQLGVVVDYGSYTSIERTCNDIFGDDTNIQFSDCGKLVLAEVFEVTCDSSFGCQASDCCVVAPSLVPEENPAPPPEDLIATDEIRIEGEITINLNCSQLLNTEFIQLAIAETCKTALEAQGHDSDSISEDNVVIISTSCSEGGSLGLRRRLNDAQLVVDYEIIIDEETAAEAGITSAADVAIIEHAFDTVIDDGTGTEKDVFLEALSKYLEEKENIVIAPEDMSFTATKFKDKTAYTEKEMENGTNAGGAKDSSGLKAYTIVILAVACIAGLVICVHRCLFRRPAVRDTDLEMRAILSDQM